MFEIIVEIKTKSVLARIGFQVLSNFFSGFLKRNCGISLRNPYVLSRDRTRDRNLKQLKIF
jgi:hypothetical protein